MKKVYLIIISLMISSFCYSQTDRSYVNKHDDEKIESLKKKLKNHLNVKNKRIKEFISKNKEIEKISGKKIVDIYNGKPIYQTTHNQDAAISTRTNFLNDSRSLNLNGENYEIMVWDEKLALITHVEFTDSEGLSKIKLPDAIVPLEFSDHATHVTGTIGASGVNPNAKGMASKVSLSSFDWDSDIIEVANNAENGLLISNHSYGISVNQDDDILPAYFMGSYNQEALLWDEIHFDFPYYLMVVSAGNDGTTSYNGGTLNGYDKLTGEKNSKNNLVVANARDAIINTNGSGELLSVFINSSSSQGPSDDGRIKPDISGNGTTLYSTSSDSNNAYNNKTGTSMAAPNVSGTLILLHELYYKTNQETMRSATVKGLVCHTADDVGNIGPDAIFGWGLMNAKAAGEAILNRENQTSIIHEEILNNNGTFSFDVTVFNKSSLKATICWTDPAGLGSENNFNVNTTNLTTPSLINDLDLRIYDENANEFLPYKLNIENVAGSATRGDNFVDNVEQVEIEFPFDGNYTIEVSHKGILINEQQAFSIIVTGISASTLNNTNFDENEDITYWPNPVKNQLNISSSELDFSDETQVTIYDMVGRRMINKKDFDSTTNLSLDMSSLTKGIYILKLTDGAQSIQKRIIKE